MNIPENEKIEGFEYGAHWSTPGRSGWHVRKSDGPWVQARATPAPNELPDDYDEAYREAVAELTVSLLDYNSVKPITYLWICGVGCPTGIDYRHWDQPDDGSPAEDYCDVNDVIGELNLWHLNGTVTNNRWEWDGVGSPTDLRGNSILNIKAS